MIFQFLFLSYILFSAHYNDVIMIAMASQITSLTIVYSTVYSGRSKKTSKLRVTGLCAGNSPVTGEFPAQIASNVENVSIWWRHHGKRAEATDWWCTKGATTCDIQRPYPMLHNAISVWSSPLGSYSLHMMKWMTGKGSDDYLRPSLFYRRLGYHMDVTFYQREFDEWSLIARM